MHRRIWPFLALLAILPIAAVVYYVTADHEEAPPELPGMRAPRAHAPPSNVPPIIPEADAPSAGDPGKADDAAARAGMVPPGVPSVAPTGDGVVRGHILDERERPVPNAAVSLWIPAAPTGDFGGFGRILGTKQRWVGTVRSKADGTFRFRRLSPETTHTIMVCHATMAPVARTFQLTRYPAPTDLGAVRVRIGGKITGQCVDGEGNPVAGAAVFAVRTMRPGRAPTGLPTTITAQAELEKRSPWLEVRSGADGRFELTGTQTGEVYAAAIKAGRRPGVSGRFEVAPGGQVAHARIVLAVGFAIAGRVVDHKDRPVVGATVQVEPLAVEKPLRARLPRSLGSVALLRGDRLVDTDADGRFRVDGLPKGAYRLLAWHAGRVATRDKVQAGDEAVRVAFEAVAEVTVRGTVASRGDGAAVADARVWLTLNVKTDRAPTRVPDAVTDARGAFEIATPVAKGRRKLRVEAAGYATEESAPFAVEQAPPEMRITLDAGATISGVVVAAGAADPIAEAVVFLRLDSGADLSPFGGLQIETNRPAIARASSDAEGRFRLNRVPPGRYRLDVQHARFASSTQSGIVVGRGDVVDDVQIALSKGGTVVVRCRYADGEAVPRVIVGVQTMSDHVARGGLRFPRAATFVEQAETDLGGVATFARLKAGRYALTWREPGAVRDVLGRSTPQSPPFTVVAGARIEQAIELDRGVDIEGFVLDGGRPVSEAAVSLMVRVRVKATGGAIGAPDPTPTTAPRHWSATTDESGRFLMENVKPGAGHVSVRIAHDGERYIALNEKATVPSARTHRMELMLPTASVRGRVHRPGAGDGPSDRPIALLLRRVDRARMFRSLKVGALGHYRFDHVPAGKYELVVRPTDEWAGARRADIIVEQGAMLLGIDLHLVAGVMVNGVVVDENDQPVFGAQVEARPEVPASRQSTTIGRGATNRAGQFQMTKLRPGSYLFRATWRKSRSEVMKIFVAETGMPEIRLKVRPYRR